MPPVPADADRLRSPSGMLEPVDDDIAPGLVEAPVEADVVLPVLPVVSDLAVTEDGRSPEVLPVADVPVGPACALAVVLVPVVSLRMEPEALLVPEAPVVPGCAPAEALVPVVSLRTEPEVPPDAVPVVPVVEVDCDPVVLVEVLPEPV